MPVAYRFFIIFHDARAGCAYRRFIIIPVCGLHTLYALGQGRADDGQKRYAAGAQPQIGFASVFEENYFDAVGASIWLH